MEVSSPIYPTAKIDLFQEKGWQTSRPQSWVCLRSLYPLQTKTLVGLSASYCDWRSTDERACTCSRSWHVTYEGFLMMLDGQLWMVHGMLDRINDMVFLSINFNEARLPHICKIMKSARGRCRPWLGWWSNHDVLACTCCSTSRSRSSWSLRFLLLPRHHHLVWAATS